MADLPRVGRRHQRSADEKRFLTRIIGRVCSAAIALTLIAPAFASELHLYLGGSKSASPSESTYSWAVEYRRPLSEHLSGSFTWLNEGHLPTHHRDGQAVQVWWQTAPARRGPRFEVGLGPYRYFDTVAASNPDGYANVHGWGWLVSAGATWRIGDRWLASLRMNRVQAHDSINSTALVAGLGYRFGASGDALTTAVMSSSMDSRRSELDVMAGATIVNSLDADAVLAAAIAWRVRATDHLTGSLTYLDEGNAQPDLRRAGIAAQLWLEDHLTDRLSVGVGLGPYFATRKPPSSDGTSTSALISVTASYAITPDWNGRLIWNRVATRYDRDSDVVLFALGYRF
jgi:hypothetical protein